MQNTQIPSHSPASSTSATQNGPCIARLAETPVTHGPGERNTFLLCGAQTGASMTVTLTEEDTNAGPPPHAHADNDEIFIIQSGAIELFANGELVIAKTGAVAYMARGEAHRFRGLDSGEPNRFNIIIAPSGFENFMARWVRLFENGAPDMAQAVGLCGEYGITLYPSDEAAPPVPARPQTKVISGNSKPRLSVLDMSVTVLLSADDTQGRYALIRIEAAHGVGAPLHVHEHEDEMFIVESGRVEFTLGEEVVVAETGDAVWGPRGHAHTFRVVSEQASIIVFITPGGGDNFFVECAQLEASGTANPATILDVAAKFGITYPDL